MSRRCGNCPPACNDAVVTQRLVTLRLIQKHELTNLHIINRPIEDFRQNFCRSVENGQIFSCIEVVRRKKDGSLFTGSLSLASIRDANGVMVDIMAAMEDITDLLSAQRSVIHFNHVLHAIRLDIGVVFMSGYTANVIAHKGILNDNVTYVQKPFSRAELAAVLKEALAKR